MINTKLKTLFLAAFFATTSMAYAGFKNDPNPTLQTAAEMLAHSVREQDAKTFRKAFLNGDKAVVKRMLNHFAVVFEAPGTQFSVESVGYGSDSYIFRIRIKGERPNYACLEAIIIALGKVRQQP